ncbi:MAG: domain containing CoxE-like protein, partial [Marmoricola sp.]|nr:domain containing CoxE-like protein [Marmoricola sp.]
MSLLDRHIAFIEALRTAGLPVSLSEGLDAADAILDLGLDDREIVRAAYAATLVKRHPHRAGFDHVFDLYFPALMGDPTRPATDEDAASDDPDVDPNAPLGDGPADLAEFREKLEMALAMGDPDALTMLAREAVQRFGLIRGRGPGEQRWSSYNVMNRVSPGDLVERVLQGLLADLDSDPTMRRLVEAQVASFEAMVDAEVRRRAAEVRGPEHVAKYTVRKSIEQIDFTSARKSDLEEMRREIGPLARRLATRLNKHKASKQRGPLDFRRTVRASVSSGGVPLETHHKPRRPSRSDLVVLCDVSGSVANFANFTLMLVFALREQFNRVRAFTFVDEIHEVSDRFHP